MTSPKSSTDAPAGVAAPAVSYDLPAAGVASGHERVCRQESDVPAKTPASSEVGSMGFELEPIALHALPYGPRIVEMPRYGPRRTARQLEVALSNQAPYMNA